MIPNVDLASTGDLTDVIVPVGSIGLRDAASGADQSIRPLYSPFGDCSSAGTESVGKLLPAAVAQRQASLRSLSRFARYEELPEHTSGATNTEESLLEQLQLSGVTFVGSRTTTQMGRRGHTGAVATVVREIGKYFPESRIYVEWRYGPDAAHEIAITVVGPPDVEFALEKLEEFDEGWWLDQPTWLRRSVGVYLA